MTLLCLPPKYMLNVCFLSSERTAVFLAVFYDLYHAEHKHEYKKHAYNDRHGDHKYLKSAHIAFPLFLLLNISSKI